MNRGYCPVSRRINHGVRASPKLGRLGMRHQNAWMEPEFEASTRATWFASLIHNRSNLGSRPIVDTTPTPVPTAMRFESRCGAEVGPVKIVVPVLPRECAQRIVL